MQAGGIVGLLGLIRDSAGDNVEDGWETMLLEGGISIFEIAGVAIVEGDGYGAFRNGEFALEKGFKLAGAKDFVALVGQVLNLPTEFLRGNGGAVGIEAAAGRGQVMV